MRTGTTTEIRTGIRTETRTGTRTEIEEGVRTEIQEGVRTETRTETTLEVRTEEVEVRTEEIDDLYESIEALGNPIPTGHLPVAGATVTILAVDGSYSRVVTTNAAGRFLAQDVPVGDYIVAVTADGFKTTINSEQPRPHTVVADQWTDADFVLEDDPYGDYAYLLVVSVTRGPTDRNNIGVFLQDRAAALESGDSNVTWTYSSDDDLVGDWTEARAANFITARTAIAGTHYTVDGELGQVAFVVLDLAPEAVGPGPGGPGPGPGPPVVIPEPEVPLAPFVEDHIWFVRGFEDGRFLADRTITRAEMSMILWRLLDSANKHLHQPNRFTDVANNSWYAQAVNYLASRNILRGYEDGSFRPNQPITRAEMTAVMSRFFEMTFDGHNDFLDVVESHWAFAYIVNAHNRGWITGDGGRFRPDDSTTRAEAVTIMNRVLERTPNPETIRYHLDGLQLFPDLTSAHWAFYTIMEAAIEHDFYMEDGREIWTDIFIPGR
jgi:hypothetical protein